MAKHFGSKRNPDFGNWQHDNAETDVESQDPLAWGRKSPKVENFKGPEDDLIANIDAQRHGLMQGERTVDNPLPTDTKDSELADELIDEELKVIQKFQYEQAGERYAAGLARKETRLTENRQSSPERLKTSELQRSDTEVYDSPPRAQKRYESPSQIARDKKLGEARKKREI